MSYLSLPDMLPDISKPLSRLTRHERTQSWVHLTPYLMFPLPKNEHKRNAMEMVLVAKFLARLERSIDLVQAVMKHAY